jgi:hypothetical protein
MNTPIIVEGDEWANAQYWQAYNANLNITDPANNIVYEAHQYFDGGSGDYTQTYGQLGDTANTGVQDVSSYLQWLQENNFKGYVGELGVPSNSSTIAQWGPLLNNVLTALQADDVPATVWNFEMPDSSPSWWVSQIESSSPGNLNIAPWNGQINPVMALIFEHSAPVITSFSPNSSTVGVDSTNAKVLTLTGTGAGDAAVNVYDGTTLLGTTTATVNGAWSFTTAALANGGHSFTATDVDSSGDVSEVSSALAVTVNASGAGPTVSSVVESPSSGDLDAGKTVTLTLNLSEAVTVAGGTPTLTLNDGGTATYTSGSGTNALIFSYTVAAGQNTASLSATAVNLNSATVKDGAGNAANLSLTGLTQTGPQIDTTTPAAPVITNDTINANNSVTLTGTAEANSTVTVYEGTTSLGTTTVNASGAWSFTTAPLAYSTYSFTATDTDAAGNTSPASEPMDPTISPLANANDTTIPAVAVEGSMYDAAGSSAEITLLATQFLPAQVAYAIQNGFNPQIYASEALGLVFAFGNENGSTGFATAFGPTAVGMPNTSAGDAAFAAAAANTIFGSAETTNTPGAIDSWLTNWKAFYTQFGLPGNSNPTADQIDLAARGAAWGDAVGFALANDLGPLSWLAANFLEDAAQGTAGYSASLSSQPGAASASVVTTASDVQVTGNAPATIGSDTVLVIDTQDTAAVTFAGTMEILRLEQPTTFIGTVSGFAAQDVIDLPGIAFAANTTLGYLPNSNQTGGTLSLTDGTNSANIALLGSYMASSFVMESDNHGGTMVVPEASQTSNLSLLTTTQHA